MRAQDPINLLVSMNDIEQWKAGNYHKTEQDWQSHTVLGTLNLPNGCGEPVRLRFSRSWKHFVVGTSKHLLVFNLKEGKNLHYISREYGWVNDVDVSWDDALVACAVASDSTIRLSYLADVQRGHRVIVLPKQATHVALSPTPNIIAVSLIDGGLQIFNVHTGGRLAVLGGKTRPTIHSLSFSPDWLLEAGDAGVQIWDTRIFNKPNLTPTSKFHSDKSVGPTFSLFDIRHFA
ncbi:hypothetical protein FRB99_002226 [Tulasnella sp. 403]|nr:hypothetical protein FRB99_002226 [Tulasnella sp. 403]